MTDELDKLRNAFADDAASRPDPVARNAAIEAAMLRFQEVAVEKKGTARQGNGVWARLRNRAGQIPAAFLRRLSMAATYQKLSYAMAGGVSLAALVLAINLNVSRDVAVPTVNEEPAPLLAEQDDQPQQPDSRRAIEREKSETMTAIEVPVVSKAPLGELAAEPTSRPMPAPVNRAQRSMTSSKLLGGGGLMSSLPPAADAIAPSYHDQGRDRFPDANDLPVKRVADEPVSTFSADVDTASYSFVRKSLNGGVLPPKDAVRIEELVNYFDYDYAVPASRAVPFKADVEVMPTPWNPDTQLLRIGVKGYDIERVEAPRANLVFLIDTSGSMNAPDKLPLLRQAFHMLVSKLRPDDVVSIVAYAGSAGTVLNATKVSEADKIFSALDNLTAGGSTAGGEGIRQAYRLAEQQFDKDGVNRVILATDGDFNVGISDPEQLKDFIERKRDTGVTLSVLGFGQGNYNDALMQQLAQNGNGNAAYIDTLSEARKVLVDEAGSTLFPIAKDVKFQIEFNPAVVGEYRQIGYETRQLDRADFNNDKVDAGDIGAGHTVTALYEFRPAKATGALIDPLRYQVQEPAGETTPTGEIAFLKIRYKQPEADKSELIELPVTAEMVRSEISEASIDSRFAAAVAGFGEILKGGQYTGTFTLNDVLDLAIRARGADPFNYRGGFLDLVRLAESAQAMEPLKR